jgi:glycosyltransferase involved in cell wall biosynthesis/nucleoside-diphosphate-sugar epimerase
VSTEASEASAQASTEFTVAVLGASGFVGRVLVDELRHRGIAVREVRAPRLSCPARSLGEILDLGAAQPEVLAQLRSAVTGCDVVINAAGMADPGSRDSDELYGANALLPSVLELASSQAHVQRLVHVSTAAVQGRQPISEHTAYDPLTPYARSKALGEQAVLSRTSREQCLQRVVVRPASVHGPGRPTTQRLVSACRSRFASVAGDGSGATPQTHVSEVAGALALLAEIKEAPPNIVGVPDSGLSAAELIRVLGGHEPIHLPRMAVRLVLAVLRYCALTPSTRAAVRRLELYWCGQPGTGDLWLSHHGFAPEGNRETWRRLAQPDRGRSPRILYAVTVPFAAHTLLRGQLEYVRRSGFDVRLVCSPGEMLDEVAQREGVRVLPVPMRREISPAADLTALRSLRRIIKDFRPDVVNASSPKAALVTLLAARVQRVPRRVYVVRGLRLEAETRGSLKWRILAAGERLTALCATDVVCVGSSVMSRGLELRLFPRRKARVLGRGSSNGVDCRRFQPPTRDGKNAVREGYGLDQGPVVGFVGRICYDKGVDTLVEAFLELRRRQPAQLLVVGDVLEEERPISPATMEALRTHDDIVWLGLVTDTSPCYQAMDVLALPSLREGFPNVVLEAAASGVPAVVSRSTGCVDAVQHGVTGLVVDQADPQALATALETLINDGSGPAFGAAARRLAETAYNRERVWSDLVAFLRCREATSALR